MKGDTADERFMRRALQLAARGRFFASPNPMVGAVIVHNDRIIGEGYHRRVGGPHAEVNAVNSVADADRHLLPESTIYVTLEPCSHYGRTPPCALLLIENRFKRVVIGMSDPFGKVNGRGIAMLREAGIEVHVGCLERECADLNRHFITAHTHHRPYITLKWAQSADGYIGVPEKQIVFSTPLTSTKVHRLRALHDAIAVGARTVITDAPSLTTRLWDGRSPRVVIFDRHALIDADHELLAREGAIHLTDDEPLESQLLKLYDAGITSLLVEGGSSLLQGFIDAGLYDEVHIENSPITLADMPNAVKAPHGVEQNAQFH